MHYLYIANVSWECCYHYCFSLLSQWVWRSEQYRDMSVLFKRNL